MTVSEMASELSLVLESGAEGRANAISGAYVSDLLSDVMGNANEGQVWITLQTHKNIIAIAALKELAAVIVVNGNKPSDDCMAQSNAEQIPIFSTQMRTFEVSGKLYQLLNK